jgi:hypothetical protein
LEVKTRYFEFLVNLYGRYFSALDLPRDFSIGHVHVLDCYHIIRRLFGAQIAK